MLASIGQTESDDAKVVQVLELEKLGRGPFPNLIKRLRGGEKSQLSPIDTASLVQETRDSMTCRIPARTANAEFIFLLGATRSGKSTLCNWLAGHDWKVKETVTQEEDIEYNLSVEENASATVSFK